MNADLKAKLVAALRSGDYLQGKMGFKTQHASDEKPYYCCLGVLCEVAGLKSEKKLFNSDFEVTFPSGEKNYARIPKQDLKYFGFTSEEDQQLLIGMNDIEGKTFAEIADFIEAYY